MLNEDKSSRTSLITCGALLGSISEAFLLYFGVHFPSNPSKFTSKCFCQITVSDRILFRALFKVLKCGKNTNDIEKEALEAIFCVVLGACHLSNQSTLLIPIGCWLQAKTKYQ